MIINSDIVFIDDDKKQCDIVVEKNEKKQSDIITKDDDKKQSDKVHIVKKDVKNQSMEGSGSVVECWTQDREAVGSSLTSVTVLWSLSKTHLS